MLVTISPRAPSSVRVYASACALFVASASAALPAYQVKDLGTLGGANTQAADLNEARANHWILRNR